MCQENLAKIKKNKWHLSDVVTDDESWFYHMQIGRQQSDRSCLEEDEKGLKVVRIGRFEPKTMFKIFFRTSGEVHISFLKSGDTIIHQNYHNNCLRPLVIKK